MKLNQTIKALIFKGLRDLGCDVARVAGQKIVETAAAIKCENNKDTMIVGTYGHMQEAREPGVERPDGVSGSINNSDNS